MIATVSSNYSSILSADCPSNYCCGKVNGCNYKTDNDDLCASNRNTSVPLCGECNADYSEVFGSNNCRKCAQNHYELLVLPFILSLLFVIYLLFFSQPIKTLNENDTEEIELKSLLRKDEINALKIILFKVLWYFNQSLLLVLSLGSTDALQYVLPLIQIFQYVFNLSIDFSSNSDGYCFMMNMNAFQKLLYGLIIPVMLFTLVNVVAFIAIYIIKLKERTRYFSCLWRIILISITSVMSIFFKLFACRTLQNETSVHFYFGATRCYGHVWFISLCIIIAVICVFVFLFFKLYLMNSSKRESNEKNNLFVLVATYKDDYWFWEFVLFSRRILIAIFATIMHNSYKYWNAILVILLCIYLVFHIKYNPFKHQRANTLETLCLFILIVSLICITLTELSYLNNTTQLILSAILLSSCVVPILVFMYQIGRFMLLTTCCKTELLHEKRIERLGKRTAKSQKDVFDKVTQGLQTQMEVVKHNQ